LVEVVLVLEVLLVLLLPGAMPVMLMACRQYFQLRM
jgi:hypothetical protein